MRSQGRDKAGVWEEGTEGAGWGEGCGSIEKALCDVIVMLRIGCLRSGVKRSRIQDEWWDFGWNG